jgi:hypothetical protein
MYHICGMNSHIITQVQSKASGIRVNHIHSPFCINKSFHGCTGTRSAEKKISTFHIQISSGIKETTYIIKLGY